jgi:hypothetical protein
MNRIITALALSGLFVAAPAFAKTHTATKSVATVGDKAEAPADATAKPVKKVKKTKKVQKTEKTEGSSETPAGDAPVK